MNKFLKKLVLLFFGGALVMSTAVIAILWAFSNKLPDYKFLKSYKPAVSSKVYAGEGQLVSDFCKEKRIRFLAVYFLYNKHFFVKRKGSDFWLYILFIRPAELQCGH